MQLFDDAGYGVEIKVAGYQFPAVRDRRLRYSWHMVEGAAATAAGSWTFRHPALTCNDSPDVSSWLRAAAGSKKDDDGVAGLAFTEPNLTLALQAGCGSAGCGSRIKFG
jgi:hypothetical protein